MIALIAISFALLIFLIPLLAGNRYGLITPISPLHILAYLSFFGVVTKAAIFALGDDDAFFLQIVSSEFAVVGGYLYMLLFTIFLTLGYIGAARRGLNTEFWQLKDAFFNIEGKRTLLLAVGAAAFAIAVSVFLTARGFVGLADLFSFEAFRLLNLSKIGKIEGVEGFGNSFAAIKIFFIFPAITMLLLAGSVYRRLSVFHLIAMVALTLMVMITILISGKRIGFLNLMIWFGMLYFLMGGKIGLKLLISAGLASVLVIFIFVGMTTLRANKNADAGEELWVTESLNQVVNSTYFYDVNMSIIVTDKVEMEDMLLGASYTYWTYGWIPRALWPSKPATVIGPYVKQRIFGVYGTVGGINPTGPGEAFINFGWFGCFVGAALGFLYRRVEEALLSPVGVALGGLILYPLVFFPFVQATLQSSFSASLVTAVVQTALVVGFLAALGIVRLWPPKERRAQPQLWRADI